MWTPREHTHKEILTSNGEILNIWNNFADIACHILLKNLFVIIAEENVKPSEKIEEHCACAENISFVAIPGHLKSPRIEDLRRDVSGRTAFLGQQLVL